MKLKFFSSVILLLMIAQNSKAQVWVTEMEKPDANLYQIQAEFEKYWSTRDISEKGKGYKAFKRWEHFVEPRVYPSGDLWQLQQTAPNFEAFLKTYTPPEQTTNNGGKPLGGSALIASTTWTPMGPFGAISGQAGSQLLKSGRLNFITINPTNTLNLWVGAPAGGLWMSNNGGTSWTTNTDQLPVLGCSDLVIDPTNTLVMYMATGDGDAGDTRSTGVLKSFNGGASWVSTGLSNPVTNNFLIRRLLINPNNTQIVLAATNSGIYRTINGGTNWTQVATGSTYDLEFKPGDPNTIYAGGNSFRLSTNGGASFTQITNGLPSGGFQRVAIAVTPADANYVYVLGSNGTNSGFQGLYRSTVSGTLFSAMSTSANINVLGWSNAGTDTGGQGWYDLCIAASPLNKDEIVVGGVNVWRSLDGGTNWSLYGHWVGSGAPFTHADQHDLEYAANGTLFVCNDGTVYRRTTTGWQEICGQMNISQIYKLGLSTVTPNKWISGHQDNGTSIWTGASYTARIGGDGMCCFIDRTTDQNVFGSTQNGGFQRSTNGGGNWSGATTGLSGTAPWVTIWKQDPQVSTRLYAGRQNMFVSQNLAVGWSSLTALPNTGSIIEFAIAPSNNQIIYVLKSNGIYKTTNGGTSWSTVTNGVPVASGAPQFIVIDPTDPNNAWVVLSGYSAGNKVFMTTNGGTSWINYTANLPNIPGNCAVYQPGTNDLIYVGMDVGVYHRSNTSSQWTLYNQGLPNVPISDMEITSVNGGLLHAATYGRGVWAVSLYSPTGSPGSAFTFPVDNKCVATSITFTDQSTNNPTSWSWSVTPSAGVTINSPTIQNPTITFPTAGSYTVYMQATNSIGQGTITNQIVTVANPPVLNISNLSAAACLGVPVTLSVSGASTYTWSNNGGSASTASFYPGPISVYSVVGTSNSCSVVKTITVNANPLPVISIVGPGNICPGDIATLNATGATTYTWDNGSTGGTYTVNPNSTSNYSLTGTDINGCENVAFAIVGVFPQPTVMVAGSNDLVCIDESVTLSAFGAINFQWSPGGQTGNIFTFNATGTTVYTVTGVDANGCANTAMITVSVSLCESIAQADAYHGFNVFPNPVKNKLIIQSFDSGNTKTSLEIFDAAGKLVLTQSVEFHNGSYEVQTQNLAAGNYLLKLRSSSDKVESFRLIKE